MNYKDLNDRQQEALLHTDGPLLILAGAGSGKTKVVTNKIAYLMKEKRVPSWKILAITFTNKAAREMKTRVEDLIGENADHMWIGTFHAICMRILRRNIDKIGYTSNFTIYDQGDQNTVLKEAIKDLNVNKDLYKIRNVSSRISELKTEEITPQEFIACNESDIYLKGIGEIYRVYQRRLQENNALDFDDLIIKTVELLREHPKVREFYQEKFEYIFVDEYQDTNSIQYKLIHYLCKENPNLTVVGDNDQSIYKWRGADITNILNFERDFKNAKIIKLEQNYRSSQKILNVANAVIKHNRGRIEKKLWTSKEDGKDVVYREYDYSNEEEQGVINKIQQCAYKGSNYEDMAILYRTNAQSRGFEEALIREGIPYRIVGGLRFYDRAEVKDIIAYLRVLLNPEDDVSLGRIINRPKRGIGDTSVEKMLEYGRENNLSLFQVIKGLPENEELNLRSQKNVKNFYNIINLLIEKSKSLSVGKLMETVIYETEYGKDLEMQNTVEARTKLENIEELVSSAMEYDQQGLDLEEYLSTLSLLSDVDKTAKNQGVNLMTIHGAKGLEFKIVFLVGLEEELFPSIRSMDNPEDLEEERRLCYVGVTRAEEELYLSSSKTRNLYGKLTPAKASRFIEEMGDTIVVSEENKKSSWIQMKDYKEPKAPLRHKNYVDVQKRTPFKESKEKEIGVGDRVIHKKWGEGMVVQKKPKNDDYEIVISFDGKGLKKLILSYAPISVVKK
ncbi:MAG: UvrD-helicase domain-containing protein [Tissierellia bacterium]|nr:UvrD-helicase domain-containing protein [Tissierellia bacterium]